VVDTTSNDNTEAKTEESTTLTLQDLITPNDSSAITTENDASNDDGTSDSLVLSSGLDETTPPDATFEPSNGVLDSTTGG